MTAALDAPPRTTPSPIAELAERWNCSKETVLRKIRKHGEWFEPAEPLLRFIAKRRPGSVPKRIAATPYAMRKASMSETV